MSIAKPVLRGFCADRLKKGMTLTAMIVGACSFGTFMVVRNYFKRRDEFWKNYDIEDEYLRLRELGVFQHVGPGGVIKRRWGDEEDDE